MAPQTSGDRRALLSLSRALAIKLPKPSTSEKSAHILWAVLIARIDEVFPLLCPICGGPMRVIAFITCSADICKILAHTEVPDDPDCAHVLGFPASLLVSQSFSVSPAFGCHFISRFSITPTAPSSTKANIVSTKMPAMTVLMSNWPSACKIK